MADDKSDQELRKHLNIIQSMIDVSAERLEGLRTKCATSAELTQQEIRTLEGKLIKMFSNQIVTKSKIKNGKDEHLPSLKQWLEVVGLSKPSIEGICSKVVSVEELQEKTDNELKLILNDHGANSEEYNRLYRALHNLKKYTDALKRGDSEPNDLSWDSYDRRHPNKGLSPRTNRTRADRASVPSENFQFINNNRGGAIPPSSSVSSIHTLNAQCTLEPPLTPPGHNKGKGMKFPTTPPAKIKLHTDRSANLLTDLYPLTKSKSHESQLAYSKHENGDIFTTTTTISGGRRERLPTEPGPDTMSGCISPSLSSPVKSPPYSSTGTDSDDNSVISISLQVPKSPRTPTTTARVMTHQINHRFNKKFEVLKMCAYCLKPIYLKTGLKCKECKYTCHRHCEDNVPASCGLPVELLNEFKKKMSESGGLISPQTTRSSDKTNNLVNSMRHRKSSHPQTAINIPPFNAPDSSSNTSSCNSSTPSSPAVQALSTPHSSHNQPQFNFSEIQTVKLEPDNNLLSPNVHVDSQQWRDNFWLSSLSGGSNSTDSDRTPVRVDSQDSQVSDSDTLTDDMRWKRLNSLYIREWDIPFDEVTLGPVIGTGTFGTVYQGKWHGDVAVKILNVNYLKDESTLEQFKVEVSAIRKTRHDNLILFMGACMKPPKLALVTSLAKGNTLYTHIHLLKDKFNITKTAIIAQQISQGMGYLHGKGIIHKDLKTKNIFLENGKVVITDFGLINITKLCLGLGKSNCLHIPPGWLCYLAPEIMRSLNADQSVDELPFTPYTDVYAFGTVWYELLCCEYPFKGQPPEALIWQVGKGMKQSLANLQASSQIKAILMSCWSYRDKDRPAFSDLQQVLLKFSKKKLIRSPSHPIPLSRSAESVF